MKRRTFLQLIASIPLVGAVLSKHITMAVTAENPIENMCPICGADPAICTETV